MPYVVLQFFGREILVSPDGHHWMPTICIPSMLVLVRKFRFRWSISLWLKGKCWWCARPVYALGIRSVPLAVIEFKFRG